MGIESARLRVEGVLKKVLHTERMVVDGYGNWVMQFGSAIFFIRLLPMHGFDKHIVQIFSPMLSGVSNSPQLLHAINWINAQISFGRVFWVNGVLYAFSELVAETVDEIELKVACDTISVVADTYDNELQSQFGGQISFQSSFQSSTGPAVIKTPVKSKRTAEDAQESLEELMKRDRNWHQMVMNLLDNQASGWQKPIKFF